jgi:hypothetical protein
VLLAHHGTLRTVGDQAPLQKGLNEKLTGNLIAIGQSVGAKENLVVLGVEKIFWYLLSQLLDEAA